MALPCFKVVFKMAPPLSLKGCLKEGNEEKMNAPGPKMKRKKVHKWVPQVGKGISPFFKGKEGSR